MIALGIIGFVGMLVVGAYAPDLRSGRNGGAHALSNAATGLQRHRPARRGDRRASRMILRNERLLDTEDLVVLTPESGRTT